MKPEMQPIKDMNLDDVKNVKDLVRQMKDSGGFVAKKVGIGAEILEKMVKDDECVVFLSFPASIISTGTRGIIRDLVKNKRIDVIITTCGTLDHDLARVWQNYYHGYFEADDRKLHQKGINREGNIFIPNESYGLILEEKMQPILKKIYEEGKDWSTIDLIWKFGEFLENEEKKEESIVYWAYKNKIPIFVPGPMDGAFGSQIWFFWQDGHKDFNVNVLRDEQELSRIIYDAKRTGALMIGGGISKHHTIWWNQFRDGLNYAVYITTAPEWDGSLSGARVREAISWGKVREDAKYITIEGDATVILPLLIKSID
ncbi:MAG: deoxyhypusine synthase [Candidatus Aenigmarchaeota archaeon]|nr:deoxyhypusine synthase [Candidatus Aenigmarchaeota archaeon]